MLPAKIIRNDERAWEKERDARHFTLHGVEREMLFAIPIPLDERHFRTLRAAHGKPFRILPADDYND